MSWLKENRIRLLLLLGIAVVYFGLRLPSLTSQPIFADEAIYIRWAQVMRSEATLRFLPLSDGKTPLFMWLLIPLFKFFQDPLYAGRFLSVLSGFFTLVGVTFLGWRFFSPRVGVVAALLYATTPLTVFFDRMALVDAMLAAFTIWALNLNLLLLKFQRTDLAIALGVLLGGGWLTKTPGSINLLMVPTSLAAFDLRAPKRQTRLLKLAGLWLMAIVIALVMYNLLRLGPGFSNLSSRNEDYIFGFDRLVSSPLDPFVPHIHDLTDWVMTLIGLPLSLLVVLGVALAVIKRQRIGWVILLWAGIPLFGEMLLIKTFTARYILFSVPPLIVLASWAVDQLWQLVKRNSMLIVGSLLLLMVWPAYFNFWLLTDKTKAPLPPNERRGYLEDWTAGYGLQEVANYLIEQSKTGTIAVGTEGSFGTLPDGLQIYLEKHSHTAPADQQVIVIPGKGEITPQLRQSAKERPTFFVSNASRFPEFSTGVQLLKSYPKAINPKYRRDAILLFKVWPK